MDLQSTYRHYGALGLAELVRTGQVSATELLEVAIEHTEAANPQVNAVILTMYDEARQQISEGVGEGPFAGVPFLLKDLMANYAGVPTSCGSVLARHFMPTRDSELVRRYKRAGLVVVGKTNVPEFGLGAVTHPKAFGVTDHPVHPGYTVGGSSGGSAAAVAAGMVPAAHGNDGGGSLRIPAACCGLFGLKPSRGRNPTGPDGGKAWQGMVVEHVITRTVRDSAALLDVTAGPDLGAPFITPEPQRPFLQEIDRDPGQLKIAFTTAHFTEGPVHPDCRRSVQTTAELCQQLGHQVEEAGPDLDLPRLAQAYLVIISAEVSALIQRLIDISPDKPSLRQAEVETEIIARLGSHFTARQYAQAVSYLDRTTRQVAQFFKHYDLLLTPTLALPPMSHERFLSTGLEKCYQEILRYLPLRPFVGKILQTFADKAFSFVPFTPLFNITGQPAMSVPLYRNKQGLPIGSQFAAKYGDEGLLFRFAAQLEKTQAWSSGD